MDLSERLSRIALHAFDDDWVLDKVAERAKEKDDEVVKLFQAVVASLSREEALALDRVSRSYRQSGIQKSGMFLENVVADELARNGLSFERQVTIDKRGVIVGLHVKSAKKCYHVVDLVVGMGSDIAVGEPIAKYGVISCKTSCRERWTQDGWSFEHAPRMYVLATASDDYPPSDRFRESRARKIVTCKAKNKDDRAYKLGFGDLIGEFTESS